MRSAGARGLGRLLREGGGVLREGRLVAAAQRGDHAAFEALVGPYAVSLRAFVLSRVGGRLDAADDVLQETYVAAWTGLARYTQRSRFKAWLFQIAHNKAMDHHRARYGSGETPLENTHMECPDPRDPLASAEARVVVRAFLAGLPEPQREVLELYYYAGLTLVEVAEALGRNLNTVKGQFYRAHATGADALDISAWMTGAAGDAAKGAGPFSPRTVSAA